jgi:hypothetical protein
MGTGKLLTPIKKNRSEKYMIFDNLIKAAFGFINTVAPSLNPQNFLDAMEDDFDPDLSDAENKKRMMQKIRGGKLGKPLAEAASYEPKTGKSFEELLAEAQSSRPTQPPVVSEVPKEEEEEKQKSQS